MLNLFTISIQLNQFSLKRNYTFFFKKKTIRIQVNQYSLKKNYMLFF